MVICRHESCIVYMAFPVQHRSRGKTANIYYSHTPNGTMSPWHQCCATSTAKSTLQYQQFSISTKGTHIHVFEKAVQRTVGSRDAFPSLLPSYDWMIVWGHVCVSATGNRKKESESHGSPKWSCAAQSLYTLHISPKGHLKNRR